MRVLSNTIILIILVLVCTGEVHSQISTPLEDLWDTTRVLDNPHKGWYHHFYANQINAYGQPGQDVSVIPNLEFLYLRLAWSFFEPVEDQYDWSLIDGVVEEYWPLGYKIALCITTKETGDESWGVVGEQVDGVNYATPKWVRDAGAMGTEVVNWGKTHWEPKFSDPVFLEKLADFHAAFAARYDGQPYIEYIDVCSIGDWGEGHTGFSSGIIPSAATVKANAEIYDTLYKKSPLSINEDYIYWRKPKVEQDELIAYFEERDYWFSEWSVMVEWYMKEGNPDTYGIAHLDIFQNNYLETPVIIESHHYKDLVGQGIWCVPNGVGCSPYGAEWLLKDIELLHATYISFQGWPDVYMRENPEIAKQVANRVGYWYFIDQWSTAGPVQPGDTLRLSVDWYNKGVAPAYHPYSLSLRLEGDTVLQYQLESSDNRTWLPGETTTENYALHIPAELAEDQYDLWVKLVDEQDAQREIDLGFTREVKDEQGYFRIGEVRVGESTSEHSKGLHVKPVVFPNPAGDILGYKFPEDSMSCEIYSLEGILLASKEIRRAEGSLDVSHLENGMYLIRVSGEQHCDEIRFVKQ